MDLEKYPDLNDLSIDQLESEVDYLQRKERRKNPNNGVKFITMKKLEAEKRLELIREIKEYQ